MTPEEAAEATAGPFATIAGRFMLDMATYERGGALGFDGMAFYVGGRGGVLGDVDADVVAAAFVFFNPDTIRTGWDSCREVMSRAEAAAAFAACGHDWARRSFPDELDCGRLADLAGEVVDGASPAVAPVFAGWRALPTPDDAKAAALHHLNALRELRFAFHGAATVVHGLDPREAMAVRSPAMAPLFGWTEALPEADSAEARWHAAEAATDACMARVLAVLGPEERQELATLCEAALETSG